MHGFTTTQAGSEHGRLDSGNTDAVASLAQTLEDVTAKQQEVAAATADFQTDFTEKMQGYEDDMLEIIRDMDMSEEAKASALATVTSYADQILAGKDGAVAAATQVASAVAAALSSANTTINIGVASSGTTVPAHANGTTYAENAFIAGEEGPELIMRRIDAYANGTTDSAAAFIAGENGPELILGEQGSTVFPTEETDRLITALSERRPLQIFADSGEAPATVPSRDDRVEQDRNVYVHIDGSGPIEVTGGANKEAMLEVLTNYLKPVLMSIIQGEIYEEGDYAYDY